MSVSASKLSRVFGVQGLLSSCGLGLQGSEGLSAALNPKGHSAEPQGIQGLNNGSTCKSLGDPRGFMILRLLMFPGGRTQT